MVLRHGVVVLSSCWVPPGVVYYTGGVVVKCCGEVCFEQSCTGFAQVFFRVFVLLGVRVDLCPIINKLVFWAG